MVLPAAFLVLAFALVVAGTAMVYLPAGLIVAGLLLALGALFVDPDARRKGQRR